MALLLQLADQTTAQPVQIDTTPERQACRHRWWLQHPVKGAGGEGRGRCPLVNAVARSVSPGGQQ